MTRKRQQFLKHQNLPRNSGQALVLNETVEGIGSKFRVERAGGGHASSTLGTPFKALVFTSNAVGMRFLWTWFSDSTGLMVGLSLVGLFQPRSPSKRRTVGAG